MVKSKQLLEKECSGLRALLREEKVFSCLAFFLIILKKFSNLFYFLDA